MSGRLSSHEKEKGSYFVVVTNNLDCRNNIKQVCLDFPYWAWIDHQPDNEDGSEHTHFLLRNTGTRSVKQMADKLEISPQYVQVCRKVTAFRRYMLHLDDKDKIQYTLEDVHSSRPIDFKIAIEGTDDKDIFSLYRDYTSLSRGDITPQEFLERNMAEIQRVSFTQQIKILDTIHKTYRRELGTT